MFPCVLSQVHSLWLGQVDIPHKDESKNRELEYGCLALLREMLVALELAEAAGSPEDRKVWTCVCGCVNVCM